MENQLMVHGICMNPSIWGGNNGTVALTVDITVCYLERKKEQNLVTSLSSIMENGHSIVFMEFRFFHDSPMKGWMVLLLSLFRFVIVVWICYIWFQEPVAVALSAVNLAIQFHGWVSFFILVYYKLPLRPDKKTYYEYTGLWHIYGILSMNAWLWSAVFHSR